MKVNILEAHDRYEYLLERESRKIEEGIKEFRENNIIAKLLLQRCRYVYAFIHKKEVGADERQSEYLQDLWNPELLRKYKSIEDVPSTRLLWQARLSKPMAQENSYLIKIYPNTEDYDVFWVIPENHLWSQFKRGLVTASNSLYMYIEAFITDKEGLAIPEDDDYKQEEFDRIKIEVNWELKKINSAFKLTSEEAFSTSS